MRILITGATGLVGQELIIELYKKGYTDIRILSRNKEKVQKEIPVPVEIYTWDINKNIIENGALENVEIVFHLAGESVAEGRWTQSKKQKILESRTKGTRLLMDAIKSASNRPKKVISASAIGIYGDRGDEDLLTTSSNGIGFLSEVCQKWEEELFKHSISDLKTHALRIGIVLAKNGGALKKMLPPFEMGVAGNLGNGKQYMSWIHIHDLVRQFIFLMENNMKSNIYNGVAPSPVRNSEFTKTLGKILKRPTLFPVPKFVIKTLFGEMSQILLASQKVSPSNLIDEGFQFLYSSLQEALTELLQYRVKGELELNRYQWTSRELGQVFPFFADEMNLEKITPPYLNFKVLQKSTPQIEEGTLIDYKLSLHGVPIKWRTRINKFENNVEFVDEQIKGPYTKWVHTHNFYPSEKGTLLTDHVIYKIPFGFLGRIFAGAFVAKDLKTIFNYRQEVIKQEFA